MQEFFVNVFALVSVPSGLAVGIGLASSTLLFFIGKTLIGPRGSSSDLGVTLVGSCGRTTASLSIHPAGETVLQTSTLLDKRTRTSLLIDKSTHQDICLKKEPPVTSPCLPEVQKRCFPRRAGNYIAVMLTDPDDPSRHWEGYILDRSLGGLGLQVSAPFEVGKDLWVRPTSTTTLPWTRVKVRHCQRSGRRWVIGCRFQEMLPSSIMLHFG